MSIELETKMRAYWKDLDKAYYVVVLGIPAAILIFGMAAMYMTANNDVPDGLVLSYVVWFMAGIQMTSMVIIVSVQSRISKILGGRCKCGHSVIRHETNLCSGRQPRIHEGKIFPKCECSHFETKHL